MSRARIFSIVIFNMIFFVSNIAFCESISIFGQDTAYFFESKKISRKNLEQIVYTLSQWSAFNFEDCGKKGECDKNIKEVKEQIAKVEAGKFPVELEETVKYIRGYLTYLLSVYDAISNYLAGKDKTRLVEIAEQSRDLCKDQVVDLKKEKFIYSKTIDVGVGLYHCLAREKLIKEYPRKNWKAFLKKYSVKEELPPQDL